MRKNGLRLNSSLTVATTSEVACERAGEPIGTVHHFVHGSLIIMAFFKFSGGLYILASICTACRVNLYYFGLVSMTLRLFDMM